MVFSWLEIMQGLLYCGKLWACKHFLLPVSVLLCLEFIPVVHIKVVVLQMW